MLADLSATVYLIRRDARSLSPFRTLQSYHHRFGLLPPSSFFLSLALRVRMFQCQVLSQEAPRSCSQNLMQYIRKL